jgi:tRNA threonylcarbamoyladenosine biosynthesis protein TsaB
VSADAIWLLAIESATAHASVALLRAGQVVELREVSAERPASERLLPTVLSLLRAHDVALPMLDAFAVSVGPGSFTGLRVGIATAKGLAFGTRVRSLPVPTLSALAAKGARGAPAGASIVAALDARRGEVYAAGFAGDDWLAPPVWGPTVATAAELAPRLAPRDGPLCVVGDGVPILEPALRAPLGARAQWIAAPEGLPDAGWVGRLGFRMFGAGAGLDVADLAPRYLRRAEAEVRRTGERLETA